MNALLESLNTLEKRFGEARDKAEQFAAATKGVSAAASEAGNAAARSAPKMNNFVQSIARIAKYRMIRAVIRTIVDAVKEGAENFYNFTKQSGGEFANYAKALDSVKSATSQMKNQLGAAWGTLYANIAPIIIKLVDLVTRFANVLTMLFARLSGASGWYKAAEGANETADAIGGVGAAAKKALKYLAPFDELNRLPSNDNSGGGGGASSGSSGGANYEWIPFEQFDIGDGVASIFGWLRDAFDDMSAWVQSVDWANLASNMVAELSDAFGKIDWAGLTEAISEFVGSAFGAAVAFCYGAITDFVDWLGDQIVELVMNDDGTFKSGQEIVAGIWNGIVDAITDVGTWIKEHILKPFLDGFAKAFGIASPAKEMEEPGRMVGEGILAGIASVFTSIGDWVKTHVVDPLKEFLESAGLTSLSLPFSVVFEDFTLPEIKDLDKAWKNIKTKKATLTAKLAGTKEKVFTAISKAWEVISTKAATLTADLIKSFDEDVLQSIKDSWAGLKSKTAKLTAKLAGTKASTFKTVGNAWDKIWTKTSTLTANLVKSFTNDTLVEIQDAWGAIKSKTAKFTATLSASTTVKNFVKSWNALKDKTLELKAKLSETVTNAWNKAANAWNSSSILSALGKLPTFAKGGVVDQATLLGNAIVGEAGKEAIVPLERNTEWIGMVSSGLVKELAKISGGQTDNTSLTDAMYNAMSRALAENQDDRDIVLDGNVVYRSVLQRNKREVFLSGVNPMMSMT